MSTQTMKRKRVTFSVEAAHAEMVILLGDFNNWNPDKHLMKNKGNGVWSKTVMLFPGTYEYKFLVDGQWLEDTDSVNQCLNCFGTLNSIIQVNS